MKDSTNFAVEKKPGYELRLSVDIDMSVTVHVACEGEEKIMGPLKVFRWDR